MIKCNSIKYYS